LKHTASAQGYLEQIYEASPEVHAVAKLAREFFRLIRQRDLAALTPWFEAAKTTALAGFASHLSRDRDAVEAALTLPWSQGSSRAASTAHGD
jgi:transposase